MTHTMSEPATLALKYAVMRRSCGRYAAMVWARKNGCNMALCRLAVQLSASNNFNLGV